MRSDRKTNLEVYSAIKYSPKIQHNGGMIMAWKKPSPELEDIVERAVEKYKCGMKRMFGSRMYFVNNTEI